MSKKILIVLSILITHASWAVDTYNPISNQLNIPNVDVLGTLYSDVVITVAGINEVSGGNSNGAVDIYKPETNQLLIPSVIANEITYTNVLITVGEVISGGKLVTNQVKISSDIKSNVYPNAYISTFSIPNINDSCLLIASSIRYPESYKGKFQLPQVSGSFADTKIALSIAPKDDWVNSVITGSNPNMNFGCLNTHKDAFTSTLVRLKALGVNYLTIYSSTRLDDATNPKELTGYFISDSDLIWMAQQASNNGIKLRFTMQVDTWDIKGNDVYEALSKLSAGQQETWATNFLKMYKEVMLHEASVMAKLPNSFDAIKLDWSYFEPPSFVDNKRPKIIALTELSTVIRNIYNWRQWISNFTVTDYSIQNNNLTPGGEVLISAVDLIEVMPQNARTMTQDEENNLSAAFIKNFYNVLPSWLLTLKKPVIWTLQIQSQRTFFTKGWIEDCCITPSYTAAVVDFSIQAIGIEGMLEMINERTRNGDVLSDSVNISSYWWTDTMKPFESLPEISQNIRNKPAESIVYQWWNK